MKSQRKILVFAAIPAEIKAIQGRRLEPFDIDGLACLRLERPGGTRFTVCAGGIGRSAAVQSIKKVISTQKPDWIINTGSCGALSPEMTCGDIVVPGQLISMDRERRIRNQSIEKQHLDCVRISLEKENRCIHRCCLFSSEKPLCTIEEKKDARIQTGCGVVDMESFWVAETARMHECAVSVIRVVLDDARDCPQGGYGCPNNWTCGGTVD